MKIFQALEYDVWHGFRQNKYKFLIIVLIAISSCAELYVYKRNYYMQMDIPQGTCMDYLFFMLRGMKKYEPKRDLQFIFPIRWALIYLYLLYATLYYPHRDLLHSVGNQMLTLGCSRSLWWISKCIWNVMFVVSYYIVIYATIFCFCKFTNESVKWNISDIK